MSDSDITQEIDRGDVLSLLEAIESSEVRDETPEKKPLWPRVWSAVKTTAKTVVDWLVRYPVALLISVGVLAVAVILLFFGVGDSFNVGGILGKLFGKDGTDPDSNVELANTVPKGRVDAEGKPIPVGEADKEGFEQAPVEVLDRTSNPFRDKTQIEVKTPGGGTKKIRLPTGVKDVDVKEVILVQPKKFQVLVKSAPANVDEAVVKKLS